MNAVSKRPALSHARILALSLPHLSTDRIRREEIGRSWRCAAPLRVPSRDTEAKAPLPEPLALFERLGNADRIVSLCERAGEHGLCRGTSLAEARARFPGFDYRDSDPAGDARILEAIADWCDRYTPLVALDGPHGLLLDISGCTHLFGGEKALMDDLLMRLFHLGFSASAVTAPSAGTAMALVRHACGLQVGDGEERAAVAGLPVEALRLGSEVTAALKRLGLKTVGTLHDLPREGLARRFGPGLMVRLDEASGTSRRPIEPRRALPALTAERRFAEPIARTEDIERVLVFLAGRLAGDLETRGQGARAFEFSLFRADGDTERVRVRSVRPVRDPAHVLTLFRERMTGLGEAFDGGFGYDLVRLDVTACEAMEAFQRDLGETKRRESDLASLLDRLMARLGEACVVTLEPRASHWPERAEALRPAAAPKAGAVGAAMRAPIGLPRPPRLLERPEPVETTFALPDGPPLNFRWRRALHVVRRYEGPERIAPEWWRDAQALPRDYYRIEDEDGRRYWLFREGTMEQNRPLWYMHGLFA